MTKENSIGDLSSNPVLKATIPVHVRFSEVDSLQMTWHGSYVKYLEDAREAFGEKYGFEYMFIYNNGYLAPMYDMQIRYHHQVRYGEKIIVEINYVPTRAAKLVFDYKITRESDNLLILTARTIQLFQSRNGIFEVSTPEFFEEWKKKWNTK